MYVKLVFDAQFCGREEQVIQVPDNATDELIKRQFMPAFGIQYDENCSFEIQK